MKATIYWYSEGKGIRVKVGRRKYLFFSRTDTRDEIEKKVLQGLTINLQEGEQIRFSHIGKNIPD